MLLFQEPFNVIKYDVIGDGNAGNYFRVDASSGVLSVANDLRNDQQRTYNVSTSACERHFLHCLIVNA